MSCDGTGICNGRDIPTNTTKEADVCIIGSGPAGVSAAWKLAEAGLKVILLDGSRQLHYPAADSPDQNYYQQSWPDKRNLYNGVATGIFATNEPDFLVLPTQPYPEFPWERERVFGGTPVHGGGQCRPQDPVDIEGRGSVFPKWPIPYAELDGFYNEASVANHLSGDYPLNFTAKFWERQLQLTNAIPKLPGFDAEMYQFMGSPPKGKWKNFATRPWGKRQETIDRFVQVIVNATVLEIVVAGGAVAWLNVASMQDNYPQQPMKPDKPKVATGFKVHAYIYILACGAVENARQLLLSNIGDKKLVGHYFMCHPLSKGGIIRTNKSYLSDDQYKLMSGNDKQGSQWFDPAFNNTVQGRFITNPQITRTKGIGRCWFWANHAGDSSQMYFEMAPNYESYVGLDDNGPRDPVFSQKQTKIHWSLTNTDRLTYEKNCEEFNSSVQGAISYPTWEQTIAEKQWVVNGHHMGTTRMSVKPEEGVVDENLKVHGINNLYVAGSSVFPTGGVSNPTMTIVALSLRLAAQVQKRIGKPSRAVAAKAPSKGVAKGRAKKS
jgi:choline dehydrogenase-like flavoprotein